MGAEKQTAYVVTCPRCDTRNAYSTSVAGKDVRCDLCGTRFTAPKAVKRQQKAASRKAKQLGGSGLEKDASAGQKKSADTRMFAVECTLCGTRMAFRAEHAGRRARCPDCRTQLTVPQPPPLPKKTVTTTESYAVSDEEPPTPPHLEHAAAGYSYIPRAGEAGPLFSEDEIAEPEKDEHAPAAKRRQSPTHNDPDVSSWAAPLPSSPTTYSTHPPDAPPSTSPNQQGSASRWKNEVPAPAPQQSNFDPHAHSRKPPREKPQPEHPRKKKLSRAERNTQRIAQQRAEASPYADPRNNPIPAAVRFPMINGVYTMPFHGQSLLRWFVLTLLLGLFGGFLALTIYLVGKFPPTVFYMIPGLVLFGLLAGGYASVCVHAVAVDTANGARDVDGWSDMDWRNWVFAFFQFAIAGMLIFAVGMLLARLTGAPLEWQRLIAAYFVAIFLPVYYASSLYENTYVIIISRFVARSLLSVPHAWLSLYLQNTVLLFAFGFGFVLLRDVSAITALALACPLLAAFVFIWARLIGRVLWVAGKAALATANQD